MESFVDLKIAGVEEAQVFDSIPVLLDNLKLTMKKLLYIPLAVLIVVACDKKDDPKPVSKLVGKWTAVSSQTTMTINGVSYKDYLMSFGFTEQEATEAADELAQMLTLTGFDADMEFRADGTWTGQSQFVSVPVTGKWTLSDNDAKLTVTNDALPGQTQSANISKLTEADLWLEVVLDPSQLPAGTPLAFQYSATLKLTRKP